MKVLFIHQGLISFVEKDLGIIKTMHKVADLQFSSLKDIFPLWWMVKWCDITFSWFGLRHAFFAVLFSKLQRKKSIVVAGGYDVAKCPEINYGLYYRKLKRLFSVLMFKLVDVVLTVSDFNTQETLQNAKVKPDKVKTVYHGFDDKKFNKIGKIKKEDLVLTVGGVDRVRVRRKGYELFVKTANYLPDLQFILIGKWIDDSISYLKKIASPNVKFLQDVNDEDLIEILTKAKVYVQVSLHEAFGCSLAEAMLCECVPVISRHAAVPEVVGDCGIYVNELKPEVAAEKIKEAIASNGVGEKARKRIVSLFPLEKRKARILETIENLKPE